MKRRAFTVGRREASVHKRAEEAGEVDVDGECGLLGPTGRRVREPNAEAAARRAVLDPRGDGDACLEVDARARGRDGEDGARVKRDVVAIRVAQGRVAVRVDLDGDGGYVGEVAVVGGGGGREEA